MESKNRVNKLYPLKFKKIFKKKVWGGRNFDKNLNMNLPLEELYGESWEVSNHDNDISIVDNGSLKGKDIAELLTTYKQKFVGEKVYNKYHDKFPLLIKYLDINNKLSVQVHPNDEYALKMEGEFGKSECWYILEASDDAELILGLKNGINSKIFNEKTCNTDFTNLFNVISIQKGDFINITPGTIHGSLKGSILLCEIQQNSDTTYRIYDYNRKVDGKLRELHLDRAKEIINYSDINRVTKNCERENLDFSGYSKQILIRDKYYKVDKLLINKKFLDFDKTTFMIYSIIDGSGQIICDKEIFTIKKGDTWYIPPKLNIEIIGKLEILKSFL